MNRREKGFSILELMIALAIVSLVLAAATTFFITSVNQYKVQTKIVETNVEGILGLELLRRDLEGLGFGLPWSNLTAIAYTERVGVNGAILALNDSPSNAPRAVLGIDNASFTVNHSDYLVIKSASVGMDNAAGKWTTLTQANSKRNWTPAEENLAASDYVIVLAAGGTAGNRRSLVTNSVTGSAYAVYTPAGTTNFVPVEPYSANLIYGIRGASPRRPFNRADYYVANASSTLVTPVSVPQRCAPNTGVLVKAVVEHDASGTTPTPLPLLDCVADMQVVYGLDTDADGAVNAWTDDVSTGLTAENLRDRLVEVHVHILAQEGQRDDSYQHATNPIFVGSEGIGRNFDITGYRNYRWKVYSIAVKPRNLAQ